MEHILKDLNILIHRSTIHYNESCSQSEVVLTYDFKEKVGNHLREKGNIVDFYDHTAVVTTTQSNFIYIPNQWFVVAAFGEGVYDELLKYKQCLLDVCRELDKRPKLFIPTLRNDTASVSFKAFSDACRIVFADFSDDEITLSTKLLWRFATDYSWWSGNKTINRTDFHYSVMMSMLSLVAVSQTYIAQIVEIYHDANMMPMVAELSNFTENMSGSTYVIEDYQDFLDIPAFTHNNTNRIEARDDNDEIVISVRSTT